MKVLIVKKHAKFLVGALLLAGRPPIKVVETSGYRPLWYVDMPDDQVAIAVWYGWVAGKSCGYVLGATEPEDGKQIYPT